MNTQRLILILFAMTTLVLLSACGQKGDLYLPDRNTAAPAHNGP